MFVESLEALPGRALEAFQVAREGRVVIQVAGEFGVISTATETGDDTPGRRAADGIWQ